MKFKNVLLASDFDGTLKNDEGIITPDVIEKIKYFVSEGGCFSLATGRTAGAISMITNMIDCISPSIVANGSMIYDIKNEHITLDFSKMMCLFIFIIKLISLTLSLLLR